eukprot:364269-Chlamydomonas_euryale.AAC.12
MGDWGGEGGRLGTWATGSSPEQVNVAGDAQRGNARGGAHACGDGGVRSVRQARSGRQRQAGSRSSAAAGATRAGGLGRDPDP